MPEKKTKTHCIGIGAAAGAFISGIDPLFVWAIPLDHTGAAGGGLSKDGSTREVGEDLVAFGNMAPPGNEADWTVTRCPDSVLVTRVGEVLVFAA